MHDTAAAFGAAFFRCYADGFEGARILEVGAGDVNGTLRGCAPHNSRYTGVDLAAGPGVDVVLCDPYTYPFKPATYDIVVSSSCLEHDQMFWLSFLEMCRVLGEGGFIYLNVPSNGSFHRYPTDNWRFYPDSGLALVSWARRNGHAIHLVESFIGRRRRDIWNDCVMVFGKGDTPRQLSLLAELFPRSFNIRIGERETVSNYCESTEDMALRAWLAEKLELSSPPHGNDSGTSPIEALIVSLAEREVALDATERAAAERRAAAEAQIAALRGELADRDAAAQAGQAALVEREAQLVRADAEAADLRLAHEAALQRAAAEAADLRIALGDHEVALQRADAERLDLRTALGDHEVALQRADAERLDLQGTVGELNAAVAMRQNELASVRSALARAENQVSQSASALADLEAAITTLQTEFAAVRGALAQAEDEARQRARASASAEAEADRLRRGVASLQQEVDEATAVTTEIQGELGFLRDELLAARQVGRSLLAALRASAVLAPAAGQLVTPTRGIFHLIRQWAGAASR